MCFDKGDGKRSREVEEVSRIIQTKLEGFSFAP